MCYDARRGRGDGERFGIGLKQVRVDGGAVGNLS